MRKKVLAALLTVSMVASILAGCGAKETQTESKQESSATTSKTEVKEDKKEETKPVEKPVLTWYILDNAPADLDRVEEKVNEMLEGKLDATVDFICPGNLSEKINMMTTAGEEFDLMFCARWTNPNYVTLAKKGALVDLTDLVAQYGSAITEVVPEAVLDGMLVDGGLYGIPNYQTSVRENQIVMSKELADKYEFDLDGLKGSVADGTFKEKMEVILETIKQNEPDLIPLNHQNLGSVLHSCYEVLQQTSSTSALEIATGEIVPLTECMKAYAEVFCDWYDKGYIREDIATVTDHSGDVKAGRYAVHFATDNREGNRVKFGTTFGIEGEVVNASLMEPYSFSNAAQSALTAISVTSKHPDLALQLINLLYEDTEIYNTILWGVEGIHWDYNADGTIKRTEVGKEYAIEGWRVAGSTYTTLVEEGNSIDLPNIEREYMNNAQSSILNGFNFDNTSVSTELSNVSTVAKEYSHLFNGSCGMANFDTEWEKYEKALEAAGYQTLFDESVKQIEAFLANK